MAFAPPIALDYLRRAHDGGRLGHAYLLIGGAAAAELAAQLAALVVGVPAAGVLTNPDVYVVEPESKARRILIEQIRELESALRLRASADGGRKVGILRDADRLQPQAANAFLKTLEEPPAGSLLLLLTSQPESLMETILSRCIKVALHESAADAATPQSAEELALIDLLHRHAGGGTGSLPAAYRLTREFTQLLASVRARLQGDADAALGRDEDHYAQTTDGVWLGEREAYYKGLAEARYVAERSRLLETLARWWGDALRRRALEGGSSDAASDEAAVLLKRLATVEELRENLDRNIQEALALEVAFLQMFGA